MRHRGPTHADHRRHGGHRHGHHTHDGQHGEHPGTHHDHHQQQDPALVHGRRALGRSGERDSADHIRGDATAAGCPKRGGAGSCSGECGTRSLRGVIQSMPAAANADPPITSG